MLRKGDWKISGNAVTGSQRMNCCECFRRGIDFKMTGYIDMHCDTLMKAWTNRMDSIGSMAGAADLEKLLMGGAAAQFFAIFLMPKSFMPKSFMPNSFISNSIASNSSVSGPFAAADKGFCSENGENGLPSDEEYIDCLIKIMKNTIEMYPDRIALARNYAQLIENRANGRLSAILTLEDGRVINSDLKRLELMYQKGIRLITLTWNAPNCFGAPNSADAGVMNTGLSVFGHEAVSFMEDLGIIVDVSHLSDGGFWDVARTVKGPFVASHSNCRSVANHPRNLTDDMIRAIADHGGVIGLNFCPWLLNDRIKSDKIKSDKIEAKKIGTDKNDYNNNCEKNTYDKGHYKKICDIIEDNQITHNTADNDSGMLECIAAHLRHIIRVGGVEAAAIGSDFDGFDDISNPRDASSMPALFEKLSQMGFSMDEIEKTAYGNAERVIRETLK